MSNDCSFGAINIKVPDYRIAVSTIASITAITAVLFNSLVLYSIWKTPALHKPSYILIASLALTDFVTGAIVQPLYVIANVAALMDWTDVFCNVLMVATPIGYWMGAVSLFTITVISVDRLLAIRLKSNYRSVVTLKRITAVMVFWWITGGLFAMSTLLVSHLSLGQLIIVAAVYQSVLLIILTVCYSMAFYSLKKLSSSVSPPNSVPQPATTEQPSFNVSKYRRSFNTMLLGVFCLLVFYLPYVCSGIVAGVTLKAGQGFGQDASSVLIYKLLSSSELIVFINSSVNPLLYLWRIKDLRQAAVTTLRRMFRKQSPDIQEQQQA
jgi:hypothetical protein